LNADIGEIEFSSIFMKIIFNNCCNYHNQSLSKSKPQPQRRYTKNELMVKAMKEILERPGQERPQWFHDLLESLPKYTFPIEGICEDGELVETVLKRLKKEGNKEKLEYFERYMGL
jgi:hypothetical protein